MHPKSEQINFANPIYFYIINSSAKPDLKRDLSSILDYLGTFGDIQIEKISDVSHKIIYKEVPTASYLKISAPDRFVLECEKFDNISVNIIKNVVGNMGYRIFNPNTGSFMPLDPNLIDLTTIKLEPNYYELFARFFLVPLFQYRNSNVFYARHLNTGQIHLVNRHLLEYLVEKPIGVIKNSEFSLPVAKNIAEFIALFDRGLIPIAYYETMNHPSQFLNISGFSPKRIDQDLFVAPLFFELDINSQTFKISTDFNNGRKDLLPKGSSLIRYITELIASPTVRVKLLTAKLAQDVSYESMGQGKLVPRLNLSVYFEKLGVGPLN